MKKIWFFIWKYNRQFVLCVGIILLSVILLGYTRFTYSKFISSATKRTDPIPYINNGDATDDDETISLDKDTVIIQTFTVEGAGLSSFRLLFEKDGDLKEGMVNVCLMNIDSEEIIETWEMEAGKIKNRTWTKFRLDEEIKNDRTEGYRIIITNNGIEDGKIRLFDAEDKTYYKGSLYIDDVETDKDLIMCIFPAKVESFFIKKMFYGVMLLLFIMVIIIWILINILKEPAIEKVFLIFMMFTGLAYLIVLPAYSAPDEFMHFATTYRISNKIMRVEGDTDKEWVLCRATDTVHRETGATTTLGTYRYFLETFFAKADDESIDSYNGSKVQAQAPMVSHLPQAIGITIARIFHMSNAALLFLGRFFGLMTYIILTYYAIKITPFGKQVMFAISGFPMLLEEATSFSYDGVICGLSFLLTAYILRLIYETEKLTLKNYVILFVIAIILAPCKMVYSFLVLLAFLIPNRKFGNKKIAYAYKCILAIAVIGYAVWFNMGEVSNTTSGVHIVGWANKEGYTVSYLMHHVGKAIKIYIMTFHERIGLYINGLFGGSLSWFNVNVPLEFTMSCLALLVISLREQRNYRIRQSHTVVYLVDFLVIGVLACTTMLLAWTPKSYDYIEGVQGRYFLPILPLFLLPFVNATKEQQSRARKWVMLGYAVLNMMVIMRIFEITVKR